MPPRNDAAPTSESPPLRPEVDERTRYEPRGRQEEFIVPLLREAILGAIGEAEAEFNARGAGRARTALDVGCGGQPFRGRVESAGFAYVSMDAKAQAGMAIDFECALDGEMPAGLVSRGPFELVLCTEVLEHVADWDGAFANLASLLAPGGRLIVSCPHFYPLNEEPYDFWRPTLHALRHFAGRHGLSIIEARALGDAWDVLGTAIAAATPDARGRGAMAWVAATAAKKGRKLAYWFIKSGLLRRMAVARSKLYLSNFVVMTKGTRPGADGKAGAAA